MGILCFTPSIVVGIQHTQVPDHKLTLFQKTASICNIHWIIFLSVLCATWNMLAVGESM